jgi:PleD family two-component response regulator
MAVAHELEKQVRQLAIPHLDSDIAKVVTMSLGVTSCSVTPSCRADDLLATADQQLYAAKRNGRGCVCGQNLTNT